MKVACWAILTLQGAILIATWSLAGISAFNGEVIPTILIGLLAIVLTLSMMSTRNTLKDIKELEQYIDHVDKRLNGYPSEEFIEAQKVFHKALNKELDRISNAYRHDDSKDRRGE